MSIPEEIFLINRCSFLAFADDIDNIARTPTVLRQAFLSLEKEALRMKLKINENKTKKMENGGRSNLELYQSYKESRFANFIKIQQIKWAGYVIRVNEDHTTKKVFNAQPIDT
ncbi:uncharacterized protein TNCV_3944361 [Trichonephila clavipes]|nr:uncharacterized protein TNCV_3944361 [Trichonephila clavipes]